MDEPPEAGPEARPFAPDATDMVLMVVVAIAAMGHPLLFVVAMIVWGVYIFNRVLPGSLHWRIGGRVQAALPPPDTAPAPPSDPATGTPDRDQALLTALLSQEPTVPEPPVLTALPRAPLRWRDWSQLVQQAPHVVVVGGPDSARTLVVRALLPILAQHGQVALLDPHGLKAPWPWQSIGAGRDYAKISGALQALVAEMTRRYQHRGSDPRLTVVLNAVPAVMVHAGTAVITLYPQLVSEGHTASIHTLIMAPAGQEQPPGLEGAGDLRDVLLWIYLGASAIAEDPATAAMEQPAAIRWRGSISPIDLTHVPTYARLPVDEAARWELPPVVASPSVTRRPSPSAPPSPMRHSRRSHRSRMRPSAGSTPPESADASPCAELDTPPPTPDDAGPEPAVPHVTPQEIVCIRLLHSRGHTPSAIARLLPGYTSKHYRAYKSKVDYVLRMLKEEGGKA